MPESSITNFQRQFKAGSSSPSKPFPPFPPVPNEIKNKFPELVPAWDEYQKSIAEWVRAIQNT